MNMTRMLNIREVRDVLGLSYLGVIQLVQRGDLRAYKYVGGPVNRYEVRDETKGLRFRESDIEEMLEATQIS
jgi:hypothetical protein